MFSYVKIQGDFMKKYLLLAAVLVAQLFTADLCDNEKLCWG
jgi:hypothetical protein